MVGVRGKVVVVGIVMVVVVLVLVLVLVVRVGVRVGVGVGVVTGEAVPAATLASHWRAGEGRVRLAPSSVLWSLSSSSEVTAGVLIPAAVADGRVAALRHVVGVRTATGGQLPRTDGGGGSRGGDRAEVQDRLLGETLSLRDRKSTRLNSSH